MRRIQILFVCALAFAIAGLGTLRAVEEGHKEGHATVRTVHGTVEYQDKNGAWLPVKPNMKFAPGVTIRTGADGEADISVNGIASAVRMAINTTLQIPTMSYVGTAREGDTTTMLDLKSGSILGNVKKVSANSRYEIMTPHGVAGIRGTDFNLTVTPVQQLNGTVTYNVTVSSITGQVLFAFVGVSGQTAVKVLNTGESFSTDQGGDAYATPPATQQTLTISAQGLATVMAELVPQNPDFGNNRGANNNDNNNNNNNIIGGGFVSPFPGGTGQPLQPQQPQGPPAS